MIEKQEYILISFRDITGVYPKNFTDKIYIEKRPIKVGLHTDMILTDGKFRTVYDDNWEERIVQATAYNKYKIEFIKNENYNAEMLQFADQIRIYTFDDKILHYGKILDVQVTQVGSSAFQVITIEYYDKNPANYYNSYPVINHLRSDSLITRYQDSELTKVSLTPLNHDSWVTTYTFYSAFYMTKFNTSDNKQEHELNGELINTRLTIKRKREIILYLNEEDAYTVGYYGLLCNSYTGRIDIQEPGEGIPMMSELADVEIEQIKGVDLYKCTIKITNSVINNLTYST